MAVKRSVFKSVGQVLLGRRLPTYRGNSKIKGLKGSVEIYRDEFGVPHIFANHEADAWYGLGFCQGQDRAFQIEFLNRIARGRLSEWLGSRALVVDRLTRRLGLSQVAEKSFAMGNVQSQEIFRAFSRGINDGRTLGLERAPHEYSIIRKKPSPHREEDPVLMLLLMSLLIPNNWDMELARLKILQEDGLAALRAIDPSIAVEGDRFSEWRQAVDLVSQELTELVRWSGGFSGSNNWVIAKERSATQRPWLANDPHLFPFIPPYWYLSHITTPDFECAGGGLTGTPGIIIGHNRDCAWGVTAGLVDNTDFFVEVLNTKEMSAKGPRGSEPIRKREERIVVRGKPDVIETVYETDRGPIVSDCFREVSLALSMRSTWLTPSGVPGIIGVHRAKNFEEFRSCFDGYRAMSLNMAYADRENIGWQLVGQPPERREGKGAVPKPAWEERYAWGDLVEFQRMPNVLNPAEGFFVTANNRPPHDESEVLLTLDWLEPYRYKRIVERLATSSQWDSKAIALLQQDKFSIPWREMKPFVVAALVKSEQMAIRGLAELLENWNGELSGESVEATFVVLFQTEMIHRLLKSKAPKGFHWAMGKGFHEALGPHNWMNYRRSGWLIELLRSQPAGWLGRSWDEEIQDVFHGIIKRFPQGVPDWGDFRPLTFLHPLGIVPGLAQIFNRGPICFGGDSHTVTQAGVDLAKPEANPTSVAGMRAIIDVGAWQNSRFVVAGGQSGNPFSPHYDDQLALWKAGESIGIWKGRDELVSRSRPLWRLESSD